MSDRAVSSTLYLHGEKNRTWLQFPILAPTRSPAS